MMTAACVASAPRWRAARASASGSHAIAGWLAKDAVIVTIPTRRPPKRRKETTGDMAETKAFNPNEHVMRIQGKDYLPVRWRLVWFHQETGPRAGYVTVELEYDRQNGFAKYFTIAWDGNDDTWRHVKINGIE